jgi:hypothetical protein
LAIKRNASAFGLPVGIEAAGIASDCKRPLFRGAIDGIKNWRRVASHSNANHRPLLYDRRNDDINISEIDLNKRPPQLM